MKQRPSAYFSLYSKKTELARCYLKEQRLWLGMVNRPYAS